MDVFEAIARRHSYRGDFTADEVPAEHLKRIVQAGIRAATAKNEQVVKFIIVDDPALLVELAAIINRPVCRTAKAMIVCAADKRPVIGNTSFRVEDCAASVSNMLLAVTALGYATVWLDGALRTEGVAERIARLMSVPADHEVRVVLPIGVPVTAEKQKEKLPLEQRVWFNRFGG